MPINRLSQHQSLLYLPVLDLLTDGFALAAPLRHPDVRFVHVLVLQRFFTLFLVLRSFPTLPVIELQSLLVTQFEQLLVPAFVCFHLSRRLAYRTK